LQAAVTYGERGRPDRVSAFGAGAVAVGRSAGEIHTRVHGRYIPAAESGERDGVAAMGPGAVGIGGDATGPVSTEVTGGESKRHDDKA
jgi:hypothetical protein